MTPVSGIRQIWKIPSFYYFKSAPKDQKDFYLSAIKMRLSPALAILATSLSLHKAPGVNAASQEEQCYLAQKEFGGDDYPDGPIIGVLDAIVGNEDAIPTLCPSFLADGSGECDFENTLYMDKTIENCNNLGGAYQLVLQDATLCANAMKLFDSGLYSNPATPDFTFKNFPMCLPEGEACFPNGGPAPDMATYLTQTSSGTGVLPTKYDLVFDPYVCDNACPATDYFALNNGECDLQNNLRECGYDYLDCVNFNLYPDCPIPNWQFNNLGDGSCDNSDPSEWDGDGGKVNVAECGFDGGKNNMRCLKITSGKINSIPHGRVLVFSQVLIDTV